MHYSRAGLVALVFASIISLVSAVPIPATESNLSSTLSPPSNPIPNGQDLNQLDTAANSSSSSGISLSGRMSTLPLATRLTRRQIPADVDDQLVRRNLFSKVSGSIPADMDNQLVRRGIFDSIGGAFKSLGHSIKKGIHSVGNVIKKGVQTVGGAVKTVGNTIKTGVQRVGNGIKSAATWIKKNGPTIAKFGTKFIEALGKGVGKVAHYIPVIGEPISKGAEGVSRVSGMISDKIPVKLTGKLGRGMEIMDKAEQYMDYVPGRREFSEKETFQQRDIGEAYHFEERDDIPLENREESYFEAEERDFYERYDLDWE